MSEEILKALMQFFAIVTRQDDGNSRDYRQYVEKFLRSQVNQSHLSNYLTIYLDKSQSRTKRRSTRIEAKEEKLTYTSDSVRVLGICRKINKTLSREQKVIVLVRLFEFLKNTGAITKNRLEILTTAAEVFNIEKEDYETIEYFLFEKKFRNSTFDKLCYLSSNEKDKVLSQKKVALKALDGLIKIIRVGDLETMFLLYEGNDDIYLNGLPVVKNNVHLFGRGAILKLPKDGSIYYSDIIKQFISEDFENKLSFQAQDLEYTFSNGNKALHHINLEETGGKLIALMGSSGAGKTTLLSLLSGLVKPTNGKVKINGIDIHNQKDQLEGVIGYIPQDDLLIEDLTVFDNLYHSAELCFDHLPKEELKEKVDKTLSDLGLSHVKNIKVGSPLNKKISGGQRKRLNIALELIREPSVLFVDEPTSGLSSRDSENIMDLLKMQSLKGKLIFVVIHQPSSDIYKMFNKLLILDVGGYPIYYGNPVEAVIYFKSKTEQVNSDVGECSECGNVNPELIFNLIEAKVVNDKGEFTDKRKISAEEWNQYFKETHIHSDIVHYENKPSGNLNRPNWINQIRIFSWRDIKSKVANKQYMLINLLEAPLLAVILGYLVRYIDPNKTEYVFALNKNIPAFIFMAVVVTLFMGLTLSAEEILRDRKILKREQFLSLSWSAYLMSKMFILFLFTLAQTFLFLFIGKWILSFNDLYVEHWIILFSLGCFAVLTGLLISSIFNSSVTVYILIPILLIPQMILSGAIFKFDELNDYLGNEDEVPLIADAMASRWAYEALMVSSFKKNKFNEHFFDIDADIKNLNYLQLYYIPKLNDILLFEDTSMNRTIVREELNKNHLLKHYLPEKNIEVNDLFKPKEVLNILKEKLNAKDREKQQIINGLLKELGSSLMYREYKSMYHNNFIEETVTNKFSENELILFEGEVIRKKDLIYNIETPVGINYRAQLFSPSKNLFGKQVDTTAFNLIYIWVMNMMIFIILRFRIISKLFKLE